MKEEWKDIEGYGGDYKINIKGDIVSFKQHSEGIIRKTNINRNGYVALSMYGESLRNRVVHQLVALTFIPNPENKPCVNHIDGNKQNNHINNLEWVTLSENQRHAFDTGLHGSRKGECHNNAKITEKQAIEIIQRLNGGEYQLHIAKDMNISIGIIDGIKSNNNWSHLNTERTWRIKNNKGESNHNSTITEEQAKEIIIRLSMNQRNCDISKEMDITIHVISGIKRNKTWKHIHR